MDNTSNNKTCLQHLSKTLLTDHEITFDAEQNHVRCFPHIINICTGHVCNGFKMVPVEDLHQSLKAAPSQDVSKSTYLEAIEQNPLSRAQEVIHMIRASGRWREVFMEMIKTSNQSNRFSSKVPENELLRDVPTHWDSVYFMLNCLRALRLVSYCNLPFFFPLHSPKIIQAVDLFLSLPQQGDIKSFRLIDAEWLVLHNFERILQVPHRIQQAMSLESLPRLG
jgi:hypothetical protein